MFIKTIKLFIYKARGRKALGVISNIVNILREVSLGQYYFEIAMLLREAMFLSVLLFNGETWLNITQSEISELEDLDKTLLRRIVSAPISSPVCALYAELGCYPVRLLLQSKRINFLHYILTRKSGELISKVFWVQKDVPVKNDYYSTVVRDLEEFGISKTFQEIKSLKVEVFKTLVSDRLQVKSLEYVNTLKENKSKMSDLKYN